MKCVVGYFKFEGNTWTDKKTGQVHDDADIMLLQECKNGCGFLPLSIRAFDYTAQDGSVRRMKTAVQQVPREMFKNYKPSPWDEVEVSYNQYGRIEAIAPCKKA